MLRRVLITAVAVLSILALPVAAQAAPNWSETTITTTGALVPGSTGTVVVDLINTSADAPTAGTIANLNQDSYSPAEVVGIPVVTAIPGKTNLSAKLAVSMNSESVTFAAGFASGGARVTFQMRLPETYDPVQPQFIGPNSLSVKAALRFATTGGPSNIVVDDVTPSFPHIATKDGTYALQLRVTNRGSGTAKLLHLEVSKSAYAKKIFSPVPPAFTATAVFAAGGGCVTLANSDKRCNMADLAPGASVDVTVNVGALTHYGDIEADVSWYVGDSRSDSEAFTIDITDGQNLMPATLTITGPKTGAGSTGIAYTGSVRAPAGTAAFGKSALLFEVTGFDSTGQKSGSSEDELSSITSITLSNGAACAAAPGQPNKWACPFDALAAGGTINYTLVANFPTARQDQPTTVSARFESVSSTLSSYSSQATALNVERAATGTLDVAAPKMIGADRSAAVSITLKSTGNTAIRGASIIVRVPGSIGALDPDALPSECSDAYGTGSLVMCRRAADLAPGAAHVWNLRVRANAGTVGKKLVVSVGMPRWEGALTGAFTNLEVDAVAYFSLGDLAVLDIVKPSEVPFAGVKVAKAKAQSTAQLAKLGASTVVTCPAACKAKVELRLDRKQAEKLGWAKKLKGKTAKKAKPYIVIGFGTASRAAAGKVTVKAKLSKAYTKKAAKLKAKLVVQSALTVSSTDAGTKDASFSKVTNQTFKAAKKAKKPKK